MVQKKDIDWGSLGFAYQHTDYSYVCNYKDGEWGEGELTPDHTVTLSECAGLLHYCQEVFRGPQGLHRRGRLYRLLPSRHERAAHVRLRRSPRDALLPQG